MANYDLAFPGAAIDAILTTAYDLQNAGYIFKGSASLYSGTPTQRTWLLAPAGFSGYGFSSAIPKGSIGICKWNGSAWSGDVINVVTIDSTVTNGSTNAVSGDAVWDALDELATGIRDTLLSFTITDGTALADQAIKLTYDVKMTDGQGGQHLIGSFNILSATAYKAGLMSAADKAKVDAFLDNLRSLSFTDTTPGADVGTKIVETLKMTVGGVQEAITALTILAATTSKAGLMSAADKTYLDGIPSSLTSINADINKLLAMLGYYECSTAAGTAAKTVSASGYVLTNGGCIRIKMTNANTADSVTLNINSTGAKALYYDGAQASASNSWDAGDILEVFYDGTQYQCASGGGGGKFATGENVSDTGITDTVGLGNDLITTGGVLEETRVFENRQNIVRFVSGGYFNSSCEFVTQSSLKYVDHFDITGYTSLAVCARAQANAYNFILDVNDNVLLRWQNNTSPYITNIDLSRDYPTAKYLCLSDYSGTNPHVDGVYVDPVTASQNIEALKQAVATTNINLQNGINTNKVMWDIPVTIVAGYVNSSGTFVSGGNYKCAKEIDISEYSQISCWGYSYGSIYCALYDASMNLLQTFQSGATRNFTLNLSGNYPTAKYVSVSSTENNISIGGYKRTPMSDILFNVAADAFFNQQTIIIELLNGFYKPSRTFSSSTTNRQYKSNLIAVKEGYHINVTSKGDASTLNYISYDGNMSPVSVVSGQTLNTQIVVPSGVMFYEFFSYPTALVVEVEEFTGSSAGGGDGGNILEGKSYVAIGDSFTAPIGSETIDTGMYAGMSKVYPYIIANRNNMLVINQGASGSVLNGYIAQSRYNDIPASVNYITIWYGINDTGHGISIGTVDDEPETIASETGTTTCGGFNWLFKWLYTNRPLAHIGVIITDYTEAKRREAIIACCQKWGVPYLDLYDPTIPMIRTRGGTKYEHSTDIAPLGYVEVCADAKALRNTVFSTNPSQTNIHPNNTCHEWQSTFIEAFMRRI